MLPLLEIRNLRIYYEYERKLLRAVDNVSLTIDEGEIVGIVGESGSGKSTLGLAIGRLLPSNARFVGGEIVFNGVDLVKAPESVLNKLRGREIAYVFQDPHNSLNPTIKVGYQSGEVLRHHLMIKSKREIFQRVIRAFKLVRIPDAERRFYSYPHELSGGMKQRVVISTATLTSPKLIIADEPTSALDVTIQRQLINIFSDLRERFKTSIMLITHDIGVVAELADKVAVMYAGKIVEFGDVYRVLEDPQHPYTQLLLESVPNISEGGVATLKSIPGFIPDLANPPSGCRFHPRCPLADEECRIKEPDMRVVRDRYVACIKR